jgi:hypothetical protein
MVSTRKQPPGFPLMTTSFLKTHKLSPSCLVINLSGDHELELPVLTGHKVDKWREGNTFQRHPPFLPLVTTLGAAVI